MVERDPREFHQTGSRWTLDTIRRACFFISQYTRAGIWRVLHALGVHWKHARDHVHSPDPEYLAKQAYVARCGEQVQAAGGRAVLLYQDEFTYYRQPTLASGWAARGSTHPLAERSYRPNTLTRLAGALNAATGQATVVQGTRLGVGPLVRFYEQLCATYPGQQLYLVQDNWPVHFHPDVRAALEPQEWPFAWVYPPSWPTEASPRARRLELPIQLVPLPTYASNTNPIEKLWRWLKQAVLHLHRWADDLAELRRQVLAFFEPFAAGSADLLRYVGLTPQPLPNDPAIPK
jgi:DDE superfamily endonuclease